MKRTKARGYVQCMKCGHRYKPRTMPTRKSVCPNCGKKIYGSAY